MSSSNLDLDFYESVIVYHVLTDETYMSSIIDVISPEYFDNKHIKSIIGIITEFYKNRDSIPTLTEVKSYLTTPQLLEDFKMVVSIISDFDKSFNHDELYENTEQFLKEKAVYNTILSVADDCKSGQMNTGDILSKFESACGLSIQADTGFDYFNDVDRHITDLLHQDSTVSTGWSWLDNKIGGGYLENGRAIYIYAGETNIGKSIFLGNTAVNLASAGKTVLLITLENMLKEV